MQKVYFKNIESFISTTIASAEKRVYIAVAWFTNDALFAKILEALKQDVEIKVLILDDLLNRNEFGLDFGDLANQGAEVRFITPNSRTMHHKFCIVDEKVITGSYNWTYHANKNDENVILTDEYGIVKDYCIEFENLFHSASPIILPYEHIKWTDVKEGDFNELKRNILRDVIAKSDITRELKRAKLVNLNQAYKSGNVEAIAKASSLPIDAPLKTITDVLTSRSREYEYQLWEENPLGKEYNDVDGYVYLEKWFFEPQVIEENEYHRTCLLGVLKTYNSLDCGYVKGHKLRVYDEEFIKVIRMFWGKKSHGDYELIPPKILTIEKAKLFYYQFPFPMYNKSQQKTRKNKEPRTISAINLLGIAREENKDNIIFYEGWDPQKRGEKIVKMFFVKDM